MTLPLELQGGLSVCAFICKFVCIVILKEKPDKVSEFMSLYVMFISLLPHFRAEDKKRI